MIDEKYNNKIPRPAKKQNDLSPYKEVVQPKNKAMAFVILVIVMLEPAWAMAFSILFSILSLGLV